MSEAIPEGWQMESIGKCCDILDSKRIPLNSKERSKRKGIYPYYGANGVQDHIDDYIFDGESILLAEDGGYFDEWDSRPIAYLVSGKYWVNNHAHILQARNGNSTEWVFYNLVHKNILKFINGGTRAKLNQADMREIEIPLAAKPEQQKIASILTSVDEAIEKTETQIGKLQDLKKGMMQELLTRGIDHTEFKESPVGKIPKAWKLVKLGDLSSGDKNAIVDGPFGSSINTKRDYINEGIPVIRTVNIRPFTFLEDDLKYISNDTFERVKRSAVYPGDILLSKVGTIGYSCIFPSHIERAVLSTTGSCKITVNKDAVTPTFLCYSLNYLKPYMDLIASEGVQPFLNMQTIKSFLIKIPPLKEQEKIAGTLESISDTIKIREKALSQQVAIKKALMQDLLTGKVGVKVS